MGPQTITRTRKARTGAQVEVDARMSRVAGTVVR